MTLVAVIADTHLPRGSRTLPAVCLQKLEEADLILHAGDFVTGEVLEEVLALGPVEAVHGNMDEPSLKQRLPRRHIVEVGEARIGMVHVPGAALGRAERLADWFPECNAVVYGHTHVPEISRQGSILILNPGSPTERRREPAHTMLLVRVEGTSVEAELVQLGP